MHTVQLETNNKLRFVLHMEYGKHLFSTIGNDQLIAYLEQFARYLTCNYYFRGYERA